MDESTYVTGESTFVAPKEQPPRKLSGKRTLNILTLERRQSLTEGVNLSGKKTDGASELI